MKATYSQEVTVEKIEFSKADKKKLANREVKYHDSIRTSMDGDKMMFSTLRKVNSHEVLLNEGDSLITFEDGFQKVLNSEQAKVSLTNLKKEDVPQDEPKTPE